MKDKSYAVIGGGPVGGILAARLVHAVKDLALIDINKNHLNAIRDEGLQVTGLTNFKSSINRLYQHIDSFKQYPPDVVIIATKTWALPTLLPELESVHKPGRIYVVAQNGIDNELSVVDSFGADSTLRMIINYAGNPLAPGVVKMTFNNPPNYVGGGTPKTEQHAMELAELLTDVELPTTYSDNLRQHIWKKTVMNTAMNPISALTRLTMQGIMQCEGTRTFLRRVMRETAKVANAEGFDFDEDFIRSCMAYMMKAGRHKPSMLLDVENGTPTEIDSMCRRVEQIGRKYGVPTPYNEGLAILIHGIEASNTTCLGFRIGSNFQDDMGNKICGVCPYDFDQDSIRTR